MPITLIPEGAALEVQLQDSTFYYRPLLDEEFQTITAKHSLRGQLINVSGRREEILMSALTGWSGILDEEGQDVPFDPELIRCLPPAIRETLENILHMGIIFKVTEDEGKN